MAQHGEADEGSCVPSSIRPGDVLADRYRLVDLLTESGGGRFWRAHDRVLERHVALHVIAADDERADALLVHATTAEQTSPALVVSYGAAYLVGSVISYAVLSRVLGGLRTATLLRFVVRTAIAAAVSTAAAAGTAYLLHQVASDPHWSVAAVWLVIVATVDIAVFVVLAKLMRLSEVTAVVDTVTRRLPLPRRS